MGAHSLEPKVWRDRHSTCAPKEGGGGTESGLLSVGASWPLFFLFLLASLSGAQDLEDQVATAVVVAIAVAVVLLIDSLSSPSLSLRRKRAS